MALGYTYATMISDQNMAIFKWPRSKSSYQVPECVDAFPFQLQALAQPDDLLQELDGVAANLTIHPHYLERRCQWLQADRAVQAGS